MRWLILALRIASASTAGAASFFWLAWAILARVPRVPLVEVVAPSALVALAAGALALWLGEHFYPELFDLVKRVAARAEGLRPIPASARSVGVGALVGAVRG